MFKMPSQRSDDESGDLINAFNKTAQTIVKVDMQADLVCKQAEDGTWQVYLTEIKGPGVASILGRDVNVIEKLNLDDLIPPAARNRHQRMLNDVLSKGKSSEHWSSLFENMMARPLRIKVPYSDFDEERVIDLFMRLDQLKSIPERNIYRFQVTFVNKTRESDYADTLAGITHDIRGGNSYALSLTREISELAKSDIVSGDTLQMLREKLSHLEEVLTANQLRAAVTRSDLDQSKEQKTTEDTALIASWMPSFLNMQKAIVSGMPCRKGEGHDDFQIEYTTESNLKLQAHKVDALQQFLMNLIKNAAQAGANNMKVRCFEALKNHSMYFNCEVQDDGPGIPQERLPSFFSSPIAKTSHAGHSIEEVERNRGQGVKLAYRSWQSKGGSASVSNGTAALKGAHFTLSTQGVQHPFFDDEETMARLAACDKLILLVDDILTPLKALSRAVYSQKGVRYKRENSTLNKVSGNSWQAQGLLLDTVGNTGIVYAANAACAKAFIDRYPVQVMITDQQIPGELQGCDLIEYVNQKNLDERREPTQSALHSSDDYSYLDTDCQLKLLNAGASCLKKNDIEEIDRFLTEVLKAPQQPQIS